LNRAKLRGIVLGDDAAMRRLEAIMHPLVHRAEAKFRAEAFRSQRKAVILDIPLLFETGAERRANLTVTVSCPADVQLRRVTARGLPRRDAERIVARQMPDAQKRRRADRVIPTGLSKFTTMRAVRRIISELQA
jgi:dephospho-CoA kinase